MGYAAGLVSLPATFSTPAIVYRQAGDNYILIEYGENVLDLALRLRVHVLMQHLRERAHPGIKELSPACVHCRCATATAEISQQALVALLEQEARIGDVTQMKVPSRIVHLPMAFEDSATLDTVSRYADTVRASAAVAAEQRRFYSAHQRSAERAKR